MHKSQKAFTLIEIIVVIIIIATIAGFAFVNYSKAVEKSHEQDAILQLSSIHAANQLYFAKEGQFWPPDTASYALDAINASLGLGIIANDMTYSCQASGGSSFTCTATRNAPAASFTVTVTEAALSATNPACTAGACP